MGEFDAPRVQRESTEVMRAPVVTVDPAVPVSDVPDDGVRQMFEVSADLVKSPGDRHGLKQGAPLVGRLLEAANPCARRYPRSILRSRDRMFEQQVVFFETSAAHTEVAFERVPRFERITHASDGVPGLGEDQHTAGAPIESVRQKQVLADQVSRRLQRDRSLSGPAAVGRHPGGLVDHDEVVVFEQDPQRVRFH